ncbi:hypothetical protein E2C01_032960 [Portunus trituberculatus]|uniref:Uncharacterized protein n=1 Tax=Portunus trituberculatus TaxID=210409 RepID=A0A5B7F4D0_PORTR|nr:hypothetical protein [Portunus trituberculatus]
MTVRRGKTGGLRRVRRGASYPKNPSQPPATHPSSPDQLPPRHSLAAHQARTPPLPHLFGNSRANTLNTLPPPACPRQPQGHAPSTPPSRYGMCWA